MILDRSFAVRIPSMYVADVVMGIVMVPLVFTDTVVIQLALINTGP